MKNENFMRKAIALSIESVKQGGGPFGAIIVKDGEVIATGTNCVTLHNDPTAHAEIRAIRTACERLGSFDLSGTTLYTSCEPCPMCLGAIYWAHIDKLFYGANQHDADKADFNDKFIYDEINLPMAERRIHGEQLLREEALAAFREWTENANKEKY